MPSGTPDVLLGWSRAGAEDLRAVRRTCPRGTAVISSSFKSPQVTGHHQPLHGRGAVEHLGAGGAVHTTYQQEGLNGTHDLDTEIGSDR
jgi:hypothetical protein